MKYSILVVLMAFVVGACHKENKDNVIEDFSCRDGQKTPFEGIIGGSDLHKDSKFAKSMVYIVQWKDSTHTTGGGCTGTIIDDEFVLTAAHCVDMAPKATDVEVFFTTDKVCDERRDTTDSRVATAIGFHNKYQRTAVEHENDIALVRFQNGIPQGRTTVKLATKALMKPDTSILVAGFGSKSGYGQNDKTTRLRFGIVTPLYNDSVIEKVSSKIKVTKGGAENTLYFDQSNLNGVCSGDSGGPAFEKQENEWVQIGVASIVGNSGSEPCHLISSHTNVAKYRDWIETAKVKLQNK